MMTREQEIDLLLWQNLGIDPINTRILYTKLMHIKHIMKYSKKYKNSKRVMNK